MKANAAALAGMKRPRTGSKSSTAAGSNAGGGGGGGGGGQSGEGAPPPPTSKRKIKFEEDESTTTPEGLLMSKALEILPPRELERFQAYRRSVLPSDAVASFVSHRLLHNEEIRYARRQGTRNVLASADFGVVPRSGLAEASLMHCPFADAAAAADSSDVINAQAASARARAPPLSDVVAPETSQEITVVVSTLAKCYAQRLIASARRVARATGHPDDQPLLPRHLVEAKRYRSSAGMDPGFFMRVGGTCCRSGGGGNDGFMSTGSLRELGGSTAACAALGIEDGGRLRFDAALEAQREYDEQEEDGNEEA